MKKVKAKKIKVLKKKTSVYIITKPFQYINCINIEDDNTRICLLCKHFADANSFFSIIKQNCKYFNSFLLFKSKLGALFYVILHQSRYNKLYLDSDFGLIVRFSLLFLFTIDVYTYEEGYASYSYLRQPNSLHNKILLKISNFLNIKNWSGGSSRVKGVYIYDHDYFKKIIKLESYQFLKKFKMPFIENIKDSPVLDIYSKQIDFSKFENKKLVIYLSYYDFHPEIIKIMSKYSDHYKILKAHPHITSVPIHISEIFDYSVPSNLLFEYFLYKVIQKSISVHIIHHGSFALQYLDKFNQNSVTQEIIPYK